MHVPKGFDVCTIKHTPAYEDSESLSLLAERRRQQLQQRESVTILIRDSTSRTANGYVCHICGSELKSMYALRLHVENRHLKTGPRYRCPVCHTIHCNKNAFNTHISRNHRDLRDLDKKECIV